jgi:hypothetical protein
MKDFRTLEAWKKSHQLTLSIYQAPESLPKSELFGLTSQIRRAVASLPTNIAEGCGRDGEAELGRFLNIAFCGIGDDAGEYSAAVAVWSEDHLLRLCLLFGRTVGDGDAEGRF